MAVDPTGKFAYVANEATHNVSAYPYVPGGEGSSIGMYLAGEGSLGALATPASPKFVEGTGKVMNTIPPSDSTYCEMLNEAVQMQPADVMDPEIAGQLAAIGIVKGKPFNPDARMKKILGEDLVVGNAAMRTMSIGGRASEGFGYYGPDSQWMNGLWVGGHRVHDPAGGNHKGRTQALSQR